MTFLPDDWPKPFARQMPLRELLAHGTVLYFGILVFLRVLPRHAGCRAGLSVTPAVAGSMVARWCWPTTGPALQATLQAAARPAGGTQG